MSVFSSRFSHLKEVINSCESDSVLLDIRPSLQYTKKHLRNAINFVPDQWKTDNIEEFIENLRALNIHQLIRYSNFVYKLKNERSFKSLADHVKLHNHTFTIIILKPDNMDVTHQNVHHVRFMLESIADSKTKTGKLLRKEGYPEMKFTPNIEIRVYSKSYEEMTHKYESLMEFESAPVELQPQKLENMNKIREIIPLSLYMGDLSIYLEFVENQAKKDSAAIHAERIDPRRLEKRWQRVTSIFSMDSEPPIVPEAIQLNANLSQAYGERLFEEEAAKPTEFQKKRHKIAATLRFKKEEKVTKKIQKDENIMHNHYTYDNTYEFTWNMAVCASIADLKMYLQAVVSTMEESANLQDPVLVCSGEFSVVTLVYYLLIWRKWSIRRSFRYLFQSLGDELLQFCTGKYFADCMDLLLREEAEILPHTWPSISLISFITFSLGQETNLATNISSFHNIHKPLERELFQAISAGDTKRVKELVTEYPFLVMARTTCRKSPAEDYTPILSTLNCQNNTVRRDSECLNLLSTTEALQLTTLSGHDALYYAIECGDEMVKFFLKKDINTNRCSMKLRMNALQRAIKFQLSPSTLISLMNNYTVNHRDSYQRTPAMYIIDEYSNKADVKKTLLSELVVHGADLFLQDIDKRTVLSAATDKSTELAEFIYKLINQEGTVRFPPYNSFAKERPATNVEYFIDGENTYLAMKAALLTATRSIYIADWWLTPQTYLDRTSDNPADWEASRLDTILRQKAENNVQVRVMLWENVEAVESIGSAMTQSYLESLHKNILVVRHSSSLIEGLSHHQKILIVDEYLAFVGGLDICCHRWDQQGHPTTPTELFPGKDYFNPRYVTSSDDLCAPHIDYKLLMERKIARMGWHDITFRVDGQAAFDVCINYVQRWNFIKGQTSNSYPFLLHPSGEGIPSFKTERSFPCSAQITRSVGKWSIGFTKREQSIFNAIRSAIREAEEYVYIETQFFISIQEKMDASEDPMSLSDVIVNRVRKAVREGKPFKCIVVLPMFPEGDPLEDSITLRIMYWQLHTIKYIEKKILEFTSGKITCPSDYVKFYSLANSAVIHNRPQLEQIYIHAKLLITDKVAICGSANLNMRSLLGDRDSEICVVVHNSKFAEALRQDLWNEHLGRRTTKRLTGDCLKDFSKWDSTARKNTKIYQNFFEQSTPLGKPACRSDFLKCEKKMIKIWDNSTAEATANNFNQLKNVVHGHLVKFPRHFLIDDVMNTDRYKHSFIDILNPLTPLHFLINMKEVAVCTFGEYLVQ